jgi:hypothetical protein
VQEGAKLITRIMILGEQPACQQAALAFLRLLISSALLNVDAALRFIRMRSGSEIFLRQNRKKRIDPSGRTYSASVCFEKSCLY